MDSLAVLLPYSIFRHDFESPLEGWASVDRLVAVRGCLVMEEAFDRVLDLDLLFSGNFSC
jgi:hypothetical protein